MKKISMLFAAMMVAMTCFLVTSCGDDDVAIVEPGTTTPSLYPRTLHAAVKCLNCTTDQANEVAKNLVDFYKGKMGSYATVTYAEATASTDPYIYFYETSEANDTQVKKILKSITSAEYDEVMKKTTGLGEVFLSLTADGQTIIDYSFEMSSVPTGTYTAADGTTLTLTSDLYDGKEADYYKATIVYNGETIDGWMYLGHGFIGKFESTDYVQITQDDKSKQMIEDGLFSYDLKTYTGTFYHFVAGQKDAVQIEETFTKQ